MTHAESVLNKINSKLKFLYRQGLGLSTRSRKLLCSALIQPHFDYACAAWHSTVTLKTKQKFQVCQNKMIRFINKWQARTHIGAEQISDLGWLDVSSRGEQYKLSHMFKIVRGTCPDYLYERKYGPHR